MSLSSEERTWALSKAAATCVLCGDGDIHAYDDGMTPETRGAYVMCDTCGCLLWPPEPRVAASVGLFGGCLARVLAYLERLPAKPRACPTA